MAARTLTVDPFELPNGSNPELDIIISLVDSNYDRIQGIVVADGQSIVDQVSFHVHQRTHVLDLFPQPDIAPILNEGSNATQDQSFYMVSISNRSTGYRHRVVTTVDSGGALSWAEFMAGAGPLEGGALPGWMTHINDTGIHVPVGGTIGQALVKASGNDGDTQWGTVSGSVVPNPPTVTTYYVGPGDDFDTLDDVFDWLGNVLSSGKTTAGSIPVLRFILRDGTHVIANGFHVANTPILEFIAENAGAATISFTQELGFEHTLFSHIPKLTFSGLGFISSSWPGIGPQLYGCVVDFIDCTANGFTAFLSCLGGSICNIKNGFSCIATGYDAIRLQDSVLSISTNNKAFSLTNGYIFFVSDAFGSLNQNTNQFKISGAPISIRLNSGSIVEIRGGGDMVFENNSDVAIKAENRSAVIMLGTLPSFVNCNQDYLPALNEFKGDSIISESGVNIRATFPKTLLSETFEKAQDIGTLSGAAVFDWTAGQTVTGQLGGSLTSLSWGVPTAPGEGTRFTLLLDTAGFDVLSWPDVTGWFGAPPNLSSGGTHGFAFDFIDGAWYGTHKGQVV